MNKFYLLLFTFIIQYNFGQTLLIYGGKDNDTFLGCLNCDNYSKSSIWNKYGLNGSKYNSNSIWNRYGNFGGPHSNYSPFNKYATYPPVLVDKNGNFYGYFTADIFFSKRTDNQLALLIIKYWEKISEDVGQAYENIFK